MEEKKRKKFPNYAKTCRKKTGLSQSEVAYLIGLKSPYFVCQTELGNEIQALSRALSYQIIFDKQVHEIFPLLSKHAALNAMKKIAVLSKQLELSSQTPASRRKLKFLDSAAVEILAKYEELLQVQMNTRRYPLNFPLVMKKS